MPSGAAKVALSTSSVYPDDATSAFEFAGRLGYDGIEVMVGLDPITADEQALLRLRDYHEIPVLSVHAPCLLVTQRVWGRDPWAKLERAGRAAVLLGADVVVVHPPFRWQTGYAVGFVEGVRRLRDQLGITFAVENMYPWRLPGGGEMKAYLPDWDPTDLDYDDLTLDLSHASTARQSSLDLVENWGERLKHLHLTDGTGIYKDEHLLPGVGDQRAAEVLSRLAAQGYAGHVVMEVNTSGLPTRSEREAALGEALGFARQHLGQTVADRD